MFVAVLVFWGPISLSSAFFSNRNLSRCLIIEACTSDSITEHWVSYHWCQSTYESNVREKNINILSDLHLLSNPPGENVIVCVTIVSLQMNTLAAHVFRPSLSFFVCARHSLRRQLLAERWNAYGVLTSRVPLSWAIFDLASICPRNRIAVASTHEENGLLLTVSSRRAISSF